MKQLLALLSALLIANPALAQTMVPGTQVAVTSVATGGLLTGGPITSTGTILLSNIAAGDLVGNSTGGSAAPADTTLTALIDQAFTCSAQGSILYRGASVWTCLAPGTSGTFLETLGASANPAWATPAGGTGCTISGTVGQIVYNAGGGSGCLSSTATIGSTGAINDPAAGAASTPGLFFTGAPFTGGSGTTTFPYWFHQTSGATAATTYNANGTFLGDNEATGWTGDFINFKIAGVSSSAAVMTSAGTLTLAGGLTATNVNAGATSQLGLNGRGTFTSSGVGHITLNGSAPVVSACGTSPSIDANARDAHGTVTFGSAAPASCTVTFNIAYTTWAHCTVTFQSSLAAEAYSYTKTAITITATALSGLADYQCSGT